MSAVIARAYVNYGLDIHLLGAAKQIEAMRRLGAQMASLTRASERAVAELQMLYGVQVFSRAKVVPDLALSRGEEAHRHARLLGDRSIEFATAAGLAETHLELGEVDEAERVARPRRRGGGRGAERVARAAARARARLWQGPPPATPRACASTSNERSGSRSSRSGPRRAARRSRRLRWRLRRSAPSARTRSCSRFAERSALDAKELVRILPGHPPWGAEADAALAQVALARGDEEAAAEEARSALASLHEAHVEDLFLRIVLPAARVLLAAGSAEERETTQTQLRMVAALIAQRIADEDVRVKWFRGPVGRELSRLAGWSPGEGAPEQAIDDGGLGAGLDDEETVLLWRLVEGLTNREIAAELGVEEEVVARRLVEMYVKIGVSSRGEAAAFAFRTGMV